MSQIQWYPGHIAKTERELKPLLKWIDVVVEVLDARLPEASCNPRLRRAYSHMPVLVLLNKSDLADSNHTKAWKVHFEKTLAAQNPDGVIKSHLFDAKTAQHKAQVIKLLKLLAEPKMAQVVAKGLKRRPVRVLVVGMPNVGKSTVINCFIGQKKAKTGHKAGVTRQPQWVRIHPDIELLDTPGVIPPRLDSEEMGELLACVASVGEAAYDEEQVASFLIGRIEEIYPGHLHSHYHLDANTPLSIEAIALARRFILKGEQPDTIRTSRIILSDFRQGRWGRLSLETV